VFGGYGSISVNRKPIRAHRFSFELFNGPIPDGSLIRHTCDNPRCVNPAHLLLGDKRSNTQDAMERGQHVLGERHYKAKLSNADVVTIRAKLLAGETGRSVARQFGVHESCISQIKSGKKRRYG
jgi:hypothetical protein